MNRLKKKQHGAYIPIEGTEVLIHAATWMNLENLMLNERSQSTKLPVVLFYLMKCPE
jgi:hypothetical protein